MEKKGTNEIVISKIGKNYMNANDVFEEIFKCENLYIKVSLEEIQRRVQNNRNQSFYENFLFGSNFKSSKSELNKIIEKIYARKKDDQSFYSNKGRIVLNAN